MKYILKIEEEFVDKNTQEVHKIGDKIEVDEARGKELLEDKRHLVSLVDNDDDKSDETAEEDKELEELKQKAIKLGIKVTRNMKKDTIIEKIKEAEETKSETEETKSETEETKSETEETSEEVTEE